MTMFSVGNTYSNDTLFNKFDATLDEKTVYGSKSKIIYTSVYSVSVILSMVTMYAMTRTKKTPFAAKFLAAGLLLFDSMHSVFSVARKFGRDPLLVTSLITVTNVWTLLSLLTIWMSVIERYLLFSRPTVYLKLFTGSRIRWFITTLWILQVLLYGAIRYGVCYLRHHTMKMFSDVDVCSQITTREFTILIAIFLVTSAFAYAVIIKIIREKTVHNKLSLRDTFNKLRKYKSTAVVCIHIVSTTVITLSIGVALLLVEVGLTKASEFHLATDVMLSINSFMDPVLYAIWYPECQLKLLEMFGCFSARLRSKAVEMRYTIYNIVSTKTVSSEIRLRQNSSKVIPLKSNSLPTIQPNLHVKGSSTKAVLFNCKPDTSSLSMASSREINAHLLKCSSDVLPTSSLLPMHLHCVRKLSAQASDHSKTQTHLNRSYFDVHSQVNKPSTSDCIAMPSGLSLVKPSPKCDYFLPRMAVQTVSEPYSRQLP